MDNGMYQLTRAVTLGLAALTNVKAIMFRLTVKQARGRGMAQQDTTAAPCRRAASGPFPPPFGIRSRAWRILSGDLFRALASPGAQRLAGRRPKFVRSSPAGFGPAIVCAASLLALCVRAQVSEVPVFSFHWVDGATPAAALTVGPDGALYGTANDGGGTNDGAGVVFRIGPGGFGFHVLRRFGVASDGVLPSGPLLLATDGALYGTTLIGGNAGRGTVYRINPHGTGYTMLHSFGGQLSPGVEDGWCPSAGLALGRDGALYGTTSLAVAPGGPTIFTINPDGTGYAQLYTFAAPDQPFLTMQQWAPSAPLLLGSDGALYGTTPLGGQWEEGSVFRYDPVAMQYTLLYSFEGGPGDGSDVQASLVQGADGALYGTTSNGGTFGAGTVFRLAAPTLVTNSQQALFTPLTTMPNGSAQIRFGGALGYSYRLDASTDLVDWTALSTFSNTNGIMQWIDSDATNYPHRFYRATWVP
jgi:uncharacterized repeat protein (TIGR03803 family)